MEQQQPTDPVEHIKAAAQAFMGSWRARRNAAGADLEREFYGTIDESARVTVHVLNPHKTPINPDMRPGLLRQLVERDRAWAGFIATEAYMTQIEKGQTRGDLPGNFADLPEDRRIECLVCSLSWPTGSEVYRANVVGGVVGEWEALSASFSDPNGRLEGRLVGVLGAESRPAAAVDA